MHYAAAYSSKDVVKYLVSKGANVNAETDDNDEIDYDYGRTPLICAARHNLAEVFEYLISQGANDKVKDEYGNSLFCVAIVSGNKGVVQYLAERGAEINVRCCYRDEYDDEYDEDYDYDYEEDTWETPLHLAARYGPTKVLEYLISKGANVKAKNAAGNTPLNVVGGVSKLMMDEKKRILRAAMEIPKPVVKPKEPIWDAAVNGQWEVVKQCLGRDSSLITVTGTATIRYYECNDLTLLHLAAANNASVEVLEFIISHKANLYAKDNWDKTPLDYANTEEKKRILRDAMEMSK